ncbi:hypothetical protein [Companilactobacillus bobalius]|uniref:Uncharacterized protein n=2 Tax=Companilactobacillus bobalius TaxID=2801451 RepID=A0A202FGB1_9LACO|nr:hypothetical protein [Companilactobacillus bobalius]KAE9560139.1 hypothetical protein ATN92_07890 [Companilactobacillus bobalius]KRK82817.1 hypothetical protein FC78_GL001619 [Companilactobacillus bobalius DSM 19674]OVE99504.1 hypothetical protein LKACC16343_00617 [Companilactobacillus bobalius]GEO57487.1 hypothetical protein LBO01_06160 [Companilactobacillus paralimentarius]
MTEKLTEARSKANRKWDEKNKIRTGYLRHKARAKSFITKSPKDGATKPNEYLNDLLDMKKLLDKKINELK